jgi:hypothetical protein
MRVSDFSGYVTLQGGGEGQGEEEQRVQLVVASQSCEEYALRRRFTASRQKTK